MRPTIWPWAVIRFYGPAARGGPRVRSEIGENGLPKGSEEFARGNHREGNERAHGIRMEVPCVPGHQMIDPSLQRCGEDGGVLLMDDTGGLRDHPRARILYDLLQHFPQ